MRDAIELLMHAHYYLMRDRRFWYDKSLIDASRILCVLASDLRRERSRC